MADLIQPSFAKGEIAPALYGRVDTALYDVALRTARNLIIHTAGGASNRPGSIFIGPVKDHTTTPRLIPFQFKTTDQYILEFGALYMRVIRDDGYVLNAAKNITAATQANPVVITSTAHGYSNGTEVFIDDVVGMTQLNGNRYITANVATDTFQLTSQADGDNVDGTDYDTYISSGTVASIFEISTPYLAADLPQLKYVQSADVMTLVHNEYAVRELSRTDHDAWTLALADFDPRTDYPADVDVIAGVVGKDVARYQVTAVGADESLPGLDEDSSDAIEGVTQANPAVVTITGHGLLTGDEIQIDAVVGMTELNGRRFHVTVLTNDTFSLDGEDSTDYAAWSSAGTIKKTYVELLLNNISAITAANPAVVTLTIGHNFHADDVVRIVGVVGMTQVNNRYFTLASVTSTTVTLKDENSSTYTAYSSGGSIFKPNTANNIVSWDAVIGADFYRVYKDSNGLYGLIGETEKLTFRDDNLAVDLDLAPPSQNNPFRVDGEFPGAVAYFEQRRVFGGSLDAPDTSFYSKTGSHSNFTSSQPSQTDDAITATLNSQEVNEIRQFSPLDNLIVHTSGAEFRVDSGPDAAFGPESIKQKVQSEWGVSHIRPLRVGSSTLFVEASKQIVRSMGYSFQLDGYTSADLGLFAPHLLVSNGRSVVDWAYMSAPTPRIHMCRDDGLALTVTFDSDQDVIAWTRWDTSGKYESVAALKHNEDHPQDLVYFVVKRMVDGNMVRYIERMKYEPFEDVRDAFFVDCGLSLDNPLFIEDIEISAPAIITITNHGLMDGDEVDIFDIEWVSNFDDNFNETQPDQLNGGRYEVANATLNTFTLKTLAGAPVSGGMWNDYIEGGTVREPVSTVGGLWHLEGSEVVALCDGNVESNLIVTNGEVTIAHPASRIHIGLRYISDLETLDVESPAGGTLQGRPKSISSVVVRFEKSRGLLIGPNNDLLIEMKQRQNELYDDPIDLLTGDSDPIHIKADWNSNGRLFLRQKDPLPMTILAVIPDILLGDDAGDGDGGY